MFAFTLIMQDIFYFTNYVSSGDIEEKANLQVGFFDIKFFRYLFTSILATIGFLRLLSLFFIYITFSQHVFATAEYLLLQHVHF